MKSETLRKGLGWATSAFLIAGLGYSILTATFTPKPVFASSCDCGETFLDAEQECQNTYGLGNFKVEEFVCPVGDGAQYTCAVAPNTWWFWPCPL